ncbi:MAG: hypothetical protein JSS56_26295 [Proteobacteria bacterium]|nr:hypothetical protein [Pseudomonadota bacterium]
MAASVQLLGLAGRTQLRFAAVAVAEVRRREPGHRPRLEKLAAGLVKVPLAIESRKALSWRPGVLGELT